MGVTSLCHEMAQGSKLRRWAHLVRCRSHRARRLRRQRERAERVVSGSPGKHSWPSLTRLKGQVMPPLWWRRRWGPGACGSTSSGTSLPEPPSMPSGSGLGRWLRPTRSLAPASWYARLPRLSMTAPRLSPS
jgi:hypothetical protein